MNAVDPGKLIRPIYEWMAAQRFDQEREFTAADATRGIGLAPFQSRIVDGVLRTIASDQVLSECDKKYRLTKEGEQRVYPGAIWENVAEVVFDLKNYMLTIRPTSLFELQEYMVEVPQRLNPRQEAVLDQAIALLVKEEFWTLVGPGTYSLTETLT
ncbi:hypothetical protein N5C16_06035 [Stenotrophomonas sp. GD03908]|uniref:Uncharacterized protein n=1 Tax=Stenotrophomonas maltophilia TaxID=40324 RepID=A0AAJ2WJN0_STEMA|nr:MULTISPECIES: hypothetical protein [Stenotrophomonas]MBH1480884.1 hypothetical protein [Stenotrophomonas maltophilia]MDH0978811.1 hypothetical protein [Stenotrophomonas sp. GD03908]MDQ7294197.1 hypothetical protein [Stenotrophomonas sp. Sm0041]MDZ5764926.1 hypothetical protein [Stenotrophomonas maltophilia]